MQDVLIADLVGANNPDTMPEKPIDIIMLQRIDEEQKATAARVDDVDKSLQSLGREVSEIKGAIRPPVETPAWIRFFIYPLCVIAAGSMVAAVITLLVKVNGIETFVHDNGGFIAGLRLQQNASNPTNPQSIAEAQKILRTAQAKKIEIPQNVVEEAGKKFIEAAEKNPDAWLAAVAFLNYRTFLNADITPVASSVSPSVPTKYQYSLNLEPNPDAPHLPKMLAVRVTESGGTAPPEDSARMESLDKPNATGSGVRYLIIDGGADIVGLDGQYLKNVVVRNAIVQYNGGPVRLENVYFINCTLRFRPSPQTRDLGRNLLALNSVTFNAPKPS